MDATTTTNQPPELSAALKLLSEGCRTIAEACELLTGALAAEAEKQKNAKGEATTSAPGRVAYAPREVLTLLGVKRGVYYKIVRQGLLPYTRLYDGGPRRHLPEHVKFYEEYLHKRTVRREKS